jgi:hypothetical protein
MSTQRLKFRNTFLTTIALLSIGLPASSLLSSYAAMAQQAPVQPTATNPIPNLSDPNSIQSAPPQSTSTLQSLSLFLQFLQSLPIRHHQHSHHSQTTNPPNAPLPNSNLQVLPPQTQPPEGTPPTPSSPIGADQSDSNIPQQDMSAPQN